jgi:uncharacterized membrane protein HdeD (DUF308 family)
MLLEARTLFPPAPRARVGRRAGRAVLRAAVVAAASLAAAVACFAFALSLAAPVLLVGTVAVSAAICRIVAAQEDDAADERWLRHVLGGLRPEPEPELDESWEAA